MTAVSAREKLSPVVVRLGWVSFFTDAASEMVYPIIPIFLTVTLGAPVAALGVVEGIADGISTGLRALSGWLSDRYRRNKALVLIGYGLAAVTKPLIALANAWGVVAGLRGADRIGKAIRNAPRDVMIADATSPEQRGRAFGYHRAMDTAGAVLGPLIAIAFLLAFGRENLRPLFLIALVPGLAGLALLARIPESTRPAAKDWEPRPLPWRGPYGWFVAVSVLFGLGNSSDAFLLLRAKDAGLSVIGVIAVYALYNVVYAAISYPAGSLSDRIGRLPIFIAGLFVFAAVYAGFGLTDDPVLIWPIYAVYGAYIALTDGIGRALVVDLVDEDVRGKAIGVWQALYGASVLVAGITAGFLWDRISPRAPFFFGSAMALIAAVALVGGAGPVRKRRRSPARS
jgi:MFS family permease